MRKLRYLLILWIFLICMSPRSIYASNMMSFENLTIESGLSQATVETIVQDSDGYIWIGTNDGLNRYNGSDIKVFKLQDEIEDSIISNYITTLAEDQNRNLWVGTDEGLSKINLDNYSIKNYRYCKSDKNKPYYAILTIYVDSKGKVYMGNNDGVYLYDESKDDFDKILDLDNGLSDKNIYSMTKDKYDNLWLGTAQGIEKVDVKTNKVTVYKVGKTNTNSWGKVSSILFDNENNMWVGTSVNGLKKVNMKTNKVQSFIVDEQSSDSLKSMSIRDILQDSSNNIWIATEKGLSKYMGGDRFTTYLNKSYDNSTLANDIVYKLIEDKSGLIWAGTYTGVSIFDSRNAIEIYKNDPLDNNSLSDNVVMGVYEDEDGLLWIGTRDKGLNIIDRKNEKITHIFEGSSNHELSTNAISVIEGKDNIIWVGTRNGVNKVNKNDMTIEKYTVEDGLIDNNIKSLLLDNNNNLWIGTPKGLSVLNLKTNEITDMTEMLIKAGIDEPYIQEIYQDKDGIFWLGGYISGGLIRYDSKTDSIEMFNSYKKNGNKQEMVVNTIRHIIEDEHKNLWIGTNSGLLYFNKKDKTFKVYTEKDGLANNIVYQILVDKDKNLWISTNNGISKYDIKNNKFVNLTSTDGLQSNEFNGNSAYKCKNGDFLFGGIKGLNIFNPQNILERNYKTEVKFDNFEVSGRNYNNINGEKFNYDENFIRIKYFINDYRKNSNTQYYYKLKGHSNNWIPIKNNEVIFEDLPSGKYTFSIKYRGINGEMSKINSVSFTIKPPFWKSGLAICIYILIIIYLVYNNINKMRTLDKLVNIKTRELNNQMKENKILFDRLLEAERSKNNYFINLSHELRTPLNVINSVEQLIRSFCKSEKDLTKDKIESYMDIMKSNTDRLLNLINNIIDTSKIENGKYKLNKEECDIVYIVEEASLSLKGSIESLGINLVIDTDIEEKIINCDPHDVERCIVNLVSNAQRFTPKGGTIIVNIEDLDDFVKITVADTGVGIDPKYHNTIFDRFNQVVDEDRENKGGSGLGLTITKQIIDLHDGKISIESEKNKGTKFIIILPVD
ncbi:ligand-binding sensor domain-containing protein [Terrisporobacter sp.]